jgi:5-formyltetrahydrofolate cyclo-ligase
MALARNVLRQVLKDARHQFVKSINFESILWPPLGIEALQNLCEQARIVGAYRAMRGEPDIAALIAIARAAGCAIALPRVEGRDVHMDFRLWPEDGALERAAFGFDQPPPSAEAVLPDLILTPLVGFDRAMNRLGYGKGHYDRAFAGNHAALRIGIAWSVQETDALEAGAFDVPLDAVLTEREWIAPETGRIADRL